MRFVRGVYPSVVNSIDKPLPPSLWNLAVSVPCGCYSHVTNLLYSHVASPTSSPSELLNSMMVHVEDCQLENWGEWCGAGVFQSSRVSGCVPRLTREPCCVDRSLDGSLAMFLCWQRVVDCGGVVVLLAIFARGQFACATRIPTLHKAAR